MAGRPQQSNCFKSRREKKREEKCEDRDKKVERWKDCKSDVSTGDDILMENGFREENE